MSWSNTSFVMFVTLLASFADTIALKCYKQTSCSCHFIDGSFYDLNKLAEKGPLTNNSKNQSFVFSFQPCKNVKMDMIPGEETECTSSTGVSLCARLGTKKPVSLGSITDTKWLVTANGAELELNHPPNKTRIKLVCCEGCVTSSLIFDSQPNDSTYNLVLTTNYACKLLGPVEGLSVGSVLIILFFTFGGLYLLCGALALRFFRGAVGLELIPNYDFWSSIPGLFSDGVAYTFSRCSGNTYDRI